MNEFKRCLSIEKERQKHDLELIDKSLLYRYDLEVVKFEEHKELQYDGIDLIASRKLEHIKTEEDLYELSKLIDIKTTSKEYREYFRFELYYQYQGKQKAKSWSLQETKQDINLYYYAFTSQTQIVWIAKKNIVEVLEDLEKNSNHLIRKVTEYNFNDKKVYKYVIDLHINSKHFKNMQPIIKYY